MSNRDIIMALYSAFDRGDMDAVLALMADDIIWHEAENNKWADGNPYVGPQAVAAGVFDRVPDEYHSFAVEVGQVVADDDTVVMQGRYRARVKASGAEIAPQIVHWWTVKHGKITGFQQHVDTFALAKALGEPA
ncbi:MAG: nuclear transport factor 2 family protein [Erythrobacter sp.]|nr:nuclear transport factor 2 family protein [Erythrobacter sp.]MDZ4136136.1 nuclear transport factor 2 family protein [Paracoccaceae bacterium]MDZ4273071.1 nuclear transport factor 2 family protein [Erythrobacter sp.]